MSMPENLKDPKTAAKSIPEEEIPDSPPTDPDDVFWLTQGQKMLTDSIALTTVRAAANSLMTGFAALQTIVSFRWGVVRKIF
jgi:hypothetical protein